MVVMIAFTTMAVGLNMVVGYAGLLDLGYVAFYAVGAYTAGWFASQQFDQVSFNFGAVGIPDGLPGIHISMWLVLPIAGLLTMLAGHRDRPADAPPARRLPRDRDARLRRDRAAVRPQRRQRRSASTSRTARSGSPRSTRSASAPSAPSDRPARELPPVVRAVAVVLLDGGRDPADHRLLQRPAARLAARPRLDRDPRGRDRRRRDGHPADAHEDLGVRDRRLLRRRRGRLLRQLQGRARSRPTSTSTSRCSCSAWSSSAAWAASGA